jgi:glycosyltransferase involved in cell wall biosynthesis
VIHHPENRGYGAALRTGVAACRYEWLCMVDGDNEYDVYDLRKMLDLRDFYRLIIGFRYKKLYSAKRIFISFVYNVFLRKLFRTPFRDVSTGIRTFHRSILDEIELTCNSPFIGAELAIKTMLRGYPVGEIGIQTFPREFGSGSATTVRNILLTIRDVLQVRRDIFSDHYHLPPGRTRETRPIDG